MVEAATAHHTKTAGGWIEAGDSIEAGDWIKAGGSILAQLWIKSITIKAGLYIYAGIVTWRTAQEGDDLIECSELLGGEIKYGTLKLLDKQNDAFDEARKLLESNGFKVVKDI